MIIHTYATNGYMGWLNFFLETLKYQHGEEGKVIIDGRDLSEDDMEKIQKTYKNIEIKNKEIDYEDFMQKSGLNEKEVIQKKEKVEKFKTSNKDKSSMGKQFISTEDRYRNTIIDTINENRHEDFILHFDADTYVRKPIDDIIDLVYKNDISLILRDEFFNKIEKAIHGCFIAFRICPEIDYFFEVGREIIDGTPLKKKSGHHFGQLSVYNTYLKTKDYYNGGKVPREWFFNKDNKNYSDCMIGTGCIGNNSESLEIGKKDFEKIQKE